MVKSKVGRKYFIFLLYLVTPFLSYTQDSLVFSIPAIIDSGLHYMNSDIHKSRAFYNKALLKAQDIEVDTLLSEIYMHLGVLSRKRGNYSDAISFHQKAFSIDFARGDSIRFATDWHNIGATLRFMKEYDQAMDYLQKAIDIRVLVQDSINLAMSYSQIGILYRKKKDNASAMEYYGKALAVFQAVNNVDQEMHTNGNIAFLHYKNKAYQKSIDINLKAVEYFKETDNKPSLANRYNSMGSGYNKLNKHDLAIEYMTKSIEIAELENYTQNLFSYHKTRSKMYYDRKNYKSALEDYRMYKKYNDKANNLENTKNIERSLMKIELAQHSVLDSLKYEKREQEHQYTVNLERKKNNLYFSLLMLLLGTTGFIYYTMRRKRKFLEMMHLNKKLESEILEKDLKLATVDLHHFSNENNIKVSYIRSLLEKVKHILHSEKELDLTKGLKGLALELQRQINIHDEKEILNLATHTSSNILEQHLISKYPQLTKGEREMCLFIYSGKSVKEVIEIKGGTKDSVTSMRYRIRKKMGLKKNDELEQFIMDFLIGLSLR